MKMFELTWSSPRKKRVLLLDEHAWLHCAMCQPLWRRAELREKFQGCWEWVYDKHVVHDPCHVETLESLVVLPERHNAPVCVSVQRVTLLVQNE